MSPLQALMTQLDSLQQRAPLEELVELLSQSEIELDDVTSHVHFSDECYQRNLLHSGPHFQAWVMCWKNGQRSPIHDHSGSSCAVRVLEGVLTETLFELAPNQHVKATFSRDLLPGQVLGGEDTDIHQVSNLQADNRNLITLHVYTPPLKFVTTYSLSSARRERELWIEDFIDAAGI